MLNNRHLNSSFQSPEMMTQLKTFDTMAETFNVNSSVDYPITDTKWCYDSGSDQFRCILPRFRIRLPKNSRPIPKHKQKCAQSEWKRNKFEDFKRRNYEPEHALVDPNNRYGSIKSISKSHVFSTSETSSESGSSDKNSRNHKSLQKNISNPKRLVLNKDGPMQAIKEDMTSSYSKTSIASVESPSPMNNFKKILNRKRRMQNLENGPKNMKLK